MKPSSKMISAVKEVNSYFIYKSDGLFDRWSFKSPGDCENYSLLVLKEYYGSQSKAKSALWQREANIWYVTTNSGAGHAILELNEMYVDNRIKSWKSSLDEMNIKKAHYRYSPLIMFPKMWLGIFG